MTEEMYEYWFAVLRPLSDKKKRLLREDVGSAKRIFYIEETRLREYSYIEEKDITSILKSRKTWELENEYKKLKEMQISFVTCRDEQYPQKLLDIHTPPYAIYYKGALPDESKPAVAIVGARRCSTYGERMAGEFAEKLAEVGVQIISGMAKGVDGAGQRGALNVQGTSFGVLGCGVDICYPREHIGLYMELQEAGGVLSEQAPGTEPLPQYFPARNRIISGLSDAILVIEAKEKSGSLITADQALEQGKDIYALPGPINSALSYGCNMLIKQGAGILLSPNDLLEELHIICENKMKNIAPDKIMLETKENMVYSCLGFYPKNLSQLADEIAMPVQEILNVLISLELKGYIEEIAKNYYIVTK